MMYQRVLTININVYREGAVLIFNIHIIISFLLTLSLLLSFLSKKEN